MWGISDRRVCSTIPSQLVLSPKFRKIITGHQTYVYVSHLFRVSSLVYANLLRHLDTVWLLHEPESIFCYSGLEGDEFALKEAICVGTKSLIMFLVSRADTDTGGGKKVASGEM